ncbi:MAG TPA: hypothetical protein VEQ11_08000 [Chloroflexota bacterium]|nr:hypothetical protein [Chloroflexota bacterium]
MRCGLAPDLRGLGGGLLSLLAGLVVMSLALVTPTNGLCDPKFHELVLVHPIFPHTHDPHAAHRLADPSATPKPVVSGLPVIAPVGPFGSGLGLAVEGMLAAAPLGLLGLLWVSPLAPRRSGLLQQAWMSVPTGPPR